MTMNEQIDQNEQIEREIAELHEKIFALQKELKKIEAKVVEAENEKWPQNGMKCWRISAYGDVLQAEWLGDKYDKEMLSIGNVFRTKREALFALERLKVIAEMRNYACAPEVGKQVCYIDCSLVGGVIRAHEAATDYHFAGQPVFKDRKTAQACIDAIGVERLRKYWFGVSDE